MNETALEGRAVMPTGLQPTPPPSSPYPRLSRITEGVRLSGCQAGSGRSREASLPLLLVSGRDLDLVGGLLGLVGEPSAVNPAMTYWPSIGAIVCWPLLQAFWELGPHRSFSLRPRTKFSSSFHHECLVCTHMYTHIHTHTHTHTRTSFLLLSQSIPLLAPTSTPT